MSIRMDIHRRIEDAEDRLEDWIRNAVEDAQQEVFGDGRLDDDDLRRINEVDETLKERDDGGLWGTVQYRIYVEETEDGDEVVSLDTFGVPSIPPDIDLDVDEEKRERYNDALSDYGVVVSERVEEQFEDWRAERREQA
ncbi:MAG: hypothetical protein ACLFSW_02800 [Halobacteriales archaeon]